MPLRAALVATTCLLALAGCTPSGSADEPVARAGAVPEVVVPEAPGGTRMVEVDNGLAFAIPAEWSAVTPKEVDTDGPGADDVLDSLGMTAEQFSALLRQVDAFYAAPSPVRGFVSNINVLSEDTPLPSEAAIREQYRYVGADDVEVDDAESWLGDALITSFTMDFGQPVTIYGGAVVMGYQDGYTVVTVSSTSAAATRELRDVVLETVHETDPQRSTVRSGA